MPAKPRFSILLYSDSAEQAGALEKVIKPAFPAFYIADSEAAAIKIIVEENIDILFMGMSTITANEERFLRLLSSKETHVASIIKRKFLLCGQNEIRDAFSICNKEIFDDYFITRPLYDPYHILIRMRFLMRLFRQEAIDAANKEAEAKAFNVDEMCAFFDRISHCEQSFLQVNDAGSERLVSSITSALEQLKKGVLESDMSESQRSNLISLIESQTQSSLLNGVKSHQQEQAELGCNLQNVADTARIKKQQVIAPVDIHLQGVDLMLVVGDDKIRQSLQMTFESQSTAVRSVATAKKAVELYEQSPAQVVLMDVKLSDMSPFFVISKVRELNPNVKIVLLARPVDRDNVDECLKAGANSVLIKPIDPAVMLHKVQALIG